MGRGQSQAAISLSSLGIIITCQSGGQNAAVAPRGANDRGPAVRWSPRPRCPIMKERKKDRVRPRRAFPALVRPIQAGIFFRKTDGSLNVEQIDALRERMPESCKDMRLNLSSVLQGAILSPKQTFAVALTSAYFVNAPELAAALIADAGQNLNEGDIGDAQAAAALMGMNTIYYRSKHMFKKEAYEQRRPSLRMNRMANPASGKEQFELCALACAALAGCEACLNSHEASVIKAGLGEDHVHEVLRVAAVINGAVVALRLGS